MKVKELKDILKNVPTFADEFQVELYTGNGLELWQEDIMLPEILYIEEETKRVTFKDEKR